MPELAKIGPPGGIDVPGAVQVPRTGAALEEFRRASEETGRMGALVMAGIRRIQVENALSSAGAEANNAYLINNAAQMRNPKYLNNADQDGAFRDWVKDRAAATDKINQGLLAQPQYKPFAPELGPYLKKQALIHSYQSASRFMSDYEQNARDQFLGPTMKKVENDILNTQDGHQALIKQGQWEEALKRIPGVLPYEKAAKLDEFHQDLMVGRLTNMINAAPASATIELESPDFAAKYPLVSPDQRAALLAHADTARMRPEREATAQFAMLRGKLMTEALQKAGNGTLTPNDAQTLYNAGMPESDIKILLPGFKPQISDQPAEVNSLRNQIRNNPLIMDREDILAGVKAGTISYATAATLEADLHRAQLFAKTDIYAAAKHLQIPLRDNLFPFTPWATAGSPELQKRKDDIQRFDNDWEAAVKEAKSVKEVYGLWDSFQKSQVPMRPLKPLPPLPSPLLGETPATYIGRLHDMGFSRDELEQYPKVPSSPTSITKEPTVAPPAASGGESAGGGG